MSLFVILQVVTSPTILATPPGSNQSVFLIKTSISHLPSLSRVTCGNDNFMKIDLKANGQNLSDDVIIAVAVVPRQDKGGKVMQIKWRE